MKTYYLVKTLLPLIFLPIAPGVLQFELARQGLLTGVWAAYLIAAQGLVTLVTIVLLGRAAWGRGRKEFLRMSCVSKKVFFGDRWMTVEQYLAENHNVVVSHGMTPEESKAWVADAEDYLRRESHLAEYTETAELPQIAADAPPPDFEQTPA
jgi:hypothetical protein